MKKILLALIVIIMLSIIILISCSEKTTESTNNVPIADIVQIITSDNQQYTPPLFSEIAINQTIRLIVNASDPDNDPIKITWNCNTGEFDYNNLDTVLWTAPDTAAPVKISVSVSDGIASTNDSISFNVIEKSFLSSGGINLQTGTTENSFIYTVIFTHLPGLQPKEAKIIIDGTSFDLSYSNGSYLTGATYTYTTLLSSGQHQYYFRFIDNDDNEIIWPNQGYDFGPTVTGDGSVNISPNAIIIDQISNLNISHIDDNSISFSYIGIPPLFQTGDVIVGFGPDSTGILREILSVNIDGNQVVCSTSQSDLVSVISDGQYSHSYSLFDNNKALNSGNLVSITNKILFNEKVDGEYVTLTLEDLDINFDPELNINFEISNSRIVNFQARAVGTLEYSCNIKLNGGAEYEGNFETKLMKPKTKTTWQFIGFVPVIEVTTLNLYAGYHTKAGVTGEVKYGVANARELVFGATYDVYSSPKWQKHWSYGIPSPYPEEFGPEFDLGAELAVEVYIKPVLEVKLYSFAGPILEVRPYLGLEGELDLCNIDWSVYCGIDGNLTMEAKILDEELFKQTYELMSLRVDIESGSEYWCGDVTVNITSPPSESSFAPGEMITFTGNAYDGMGTEITGNNLVWNSSYEEVIGLGETFQKDNLSIGEHVISLTATDSEGNQGTDEIVILIQNTSTPPVATIISPTNGSVYNLGDLISFNGSATDIEDVNLTGNSLMWSSSIDDLLGTGTPFTRSDLSPGTHIITLIATDSDGQADTAMVTIEINAPPEVSITSPLSGECFNPGTEICFNATVDDDRDVITSDMLEWSSSLDEFTDTGYSICTNSLSIGNHNITLSVTDSDGLTQTDIIIVQIKIDCDSSSPISFTADDLPFQFGDSVGSTSDTLTTFDLEEWEAMNGPNQYWDFSGFQFPGQLSIGYFIKDPNTVTYHENFPNANIAYEFGNENSLWQAAFFKYNDNEVSLIGIAMIMTFYNMSYWVRYDHTTPHYNFPIEYGDQWMAVKGQPVSSDGSSYSLFDTTYFECDAWGTILIDGITYDALRLKHTLTTIQESSSYGYTTKTKTVIEGLSWLIKGTWFGASLSRTNSWYNDDLITENQQTASVSWHLLSTATKNQSKELDINFDKIAEDDWQTYLQYIGPAPIRHITNALLRNTK